MTFHKGLHTHRTLWIVQMEAKEGAPFCGAFAEPSDGLANRRPPPYHGSLLGGNGVTACALAGVPVSYPRAVGSLEN
jgi:hypothetical protein